jgi:ABC-type uncharacterized transport system permease subunit
MEFSQLPFLARCAIVGGGSAAVIGGIAGLIVGLSVHPATVWFAIPEAGVPSAIVGGVVGFAIGLLVEAVRRLSR